MRLRKSKFNVLAWLAAIAGAFLYIRKAHAVKTVNDAVDNLKLQSPADTNFSYRAAGDYISKSKFFAFINLASSEFSVPASIVEAVLYVESADGDNVKPVGNAGEIGIMQIIPSTAKYIRTLRPSLALAQPEIPSNAIRMGAALLADNYAKLHSWNKAIIAYNAGAHSPRVNNAQDWYLLRVQNRLKVLYAMR